MIFLVAWMKSLMILLFFVWWEGAVFIYDELLRVFHSFLICKERYK